MSLETKTAMGEAILAGIPPELPNPRQPDPQFSHAPRRNLQALSKADKILALKNALRYFPARHHAVLAPEFARELEAYGRIYMYRFMPEYPIRAGSITDYPHRSLHAAAIMLMIHNNLDPAVAQHPQELITYGGNGAVFQNWAQYRLTMQFLANMTDTQTLAMYSGHPMGLFPSHPEAPRVVVTNGMMIPNYSTREDWEKYNALGVTQYGQMTAGSYMYIGPQGIVHGTTLTLLNAGRMIDPQSPGLAGKIFVSSGLGGMSGAQAKAAVIAGAIGVIAEIDPAAINKRHEQGWLNEKYDDADELILRIKSARNNREAVSLGYCGNIVDLWEKLVESGISVDMGSDQTSLHNPESGGYYPAGLSLAAARGLMAADRVLFREYVDKSLVRQVNAINTLVDRGMYFFDYGNAFMVEARNAGADILRKDGSFRYPSYVEDILGPLCFDFGFGPFRWVCTSGSPEDLRRSDEIAAAYLEETLPHAPDEIRLQISDNLNWIRDAEKNQMVVGSQARILYSDSEGRMEIARRFNHAIREGRITAPIVLGRDHHDVSGTDSPFRETANIYDGSAFTADMAIQNVIGDAFRGATWVSIHNGGGVGWGKVINGGFGMVLDGSDEAEKRLKSMLFWDVNNGIARRSWARNPNARFAIERAMEQNPELRVHLPHEVADEAWLAGLI